MTTGHPLNAVLPSRKRKKKEDLRRPGLLPWLGVGAGGGALALSRGLGGNDKHVEDALAAVNRMSEPFGLGTARPNRTLFAQYADSLSAPAASTIFGIPVGDILAYNRQNRWVMGIDPASRLFRGDAQKAEAWDKAMTETRYPFDPRDNPYVADAAKHKAWLAAQPSPVDPSKSPYLAKSFMGVPYGRVLADLTDVNALEGDSAAHAKWLAEQQKLVAANPTLKIDESKSPHLPKSFLGNRLGRLWASVLKRYGADKLLDYGADVVKPNYGQQNPATPDVKPDSVKQYHIGTPWGYHGHRAGHYRAFATGPLAAYSHMVRSYWGHAPIADQQLTGGKAMTYNTYFTPKFEQFIRDHTQGSLVPNEIDLKTLSHNEQTKLLDSFVATLTPAERKEMDTLEGAIRKHLQDENMPSYGGIIRGVAAAKKKLYDVGITTGAAGIGGLLAHRAYRWAVPDKKKGDKSKSRFDPAGLAAVIAGMGLGGAAGYYGGTEPGRQQAVQGISRAQAALQRAIAGLRVKQSEYSPAWRDLMVEVERNPDAAARLVGAGDVPDALRIAAPASPPTPVTTGYTPAWKSIVGYTAPAVGAGLGAAAGNQLGLLFRRRKTDDDQGEQGEHTNGGFVPTLAGAVVGMGVGHMAGNYLTRAKSAGYYSQALQDTPIQYDRSQTALANVLAHARKVHARGSDSIQEARNLNNYIASQKGVKSRFDRFAKYMSGENPDGLSPTDEVIEQLGAGIAL